MTETKSQLGSLLFRINWEKGKLNAFWYMSARKPRKTKKKLRKLIIKDLDKLKLQRKSLIENYI